MVIRLASQIIIIYSLINVGGGALGILPISMSVLVAHLFLIPIDGCSINPTRSFGPYFVANLIGSVGNASMQCILIFTF